MDMVKKMDGGKSKMPAIERWNPILARLYEGVPEISKLTTQNDVADYLGMDKSEISRWMRGSVMRQDKVIKIIQRLRGKISSDRIVELIAGCE